MAGALVAAVALALGHHFFYQSLHNQPVPTAEYEQFVNTNVGTIFAFLFKAALGVAISAAYTQVLWKTLIGQRLEVGAVDSLSSNLSSLIDLFSWPLVVRHPGLILLATVYWLIGFAAISPPGTLSVQSITAPNTTMTLVPHFNWTEVNTGILQQPLSAYCANDNYTDFSSYYYRSSVSGASSHLSRTTALQGEVPSMGLLGYNASYALTDVSGPALQCETVPSSILGGKCPLCSTTEKDFVQYAAWISGSNISDSDSSLLPVNSTANATKGQIWTCDVLRQSAQSQDAYYGNGPPALWFAVVTDDIYPDTTSFDNDVCSTDAWTLTRCSLANTTYSMQYNFTSGRTSASGNSPLQNIQALQVTNTTEIQTIRSISDHIVDFCGNISRFLAPNDYCVDGTCLQPRDDGTIDNYLGLMTLLGRLMLGAFSSNSIENAPAVFDTAVSDSDQLRSLKDRWRDIERPSWSLSGTDSARNVPLGEAVESLFQNLTVAMLTNSDFAAYENKDVTFIVPQNYYAYASTRLIMSYAIGIGIAALIVALGCSVVIISGTSYQTRFSSFLRATHWQEIPGIEGSERSYGAAQPVPKSLARTVVKLGGSEGDAVVLLQYPGSPSQTVANRNDGETSSLVPLEISISEQGRS
ncbi:hypothetical protein LTR56_014377 [Elasticomyces elasticus]|nr:hypothetical protein LTR22_023893 [Elasticomyces elasticus]KAK3636001.1 hypothetical protein LTR56_014377 [Elasticomyces elasticus]KAK4916644.1 hypothetical protein LTR49_015342 [Elasticomyces elasticus]KAK5754918.1 hypothetical protein LTS12_014951 [Elasticomyces elasticus]